MILTCMLVSGCGSVRYTSTLKPTDDRTLDLGEVRFSIMSLYGNLDKLAERSREAYPDLFTDDLTGIPVAVKVNTASDISSMLTASSLTALCGLGTIPFPGAVSDSITVETSFINACGERAPIGTASYTFKSPWMTALSPLGLLPIPGFSDIPRRSVCLPFTEDHVSLSSPEETAYRQDCLLEAVVKTIRTADRDRLSDYYRVRKARMQEVTLDGKPYSIFLAPVLSPAQDRAERFLVLLYQDRPRRTVQALEQVTVAVRDGSGAWRPTSAYLRTPQTLTAAGVLLENGVPSRVVLRTVDEPPLQDFIDTPDLSGAERTEILRWSNGVLLEAKNHSLEKLLRKESRDDLLTLATRIEKSILDLSAQAEQAKDRAQAMVEKGQGDPAPDRELSVLCRQRIEVLKPILAALKYAATGK